MRLYEYFGVIGIASIVFWAIALGVLVAGWRRRRRHVFYCSALAIAALAFVLARINSRNVSAIELDRTEEVAAAVQAQKQVLDQLSEDGRIVSVRFAEDAPGELLSAAGAASATDTNVPAYRQTGKQKREEGKKQPLTQGSAAPSVSEYVPRTMKLADLTLANRLDRYNLAVVRLVLLLGLALLVTDYLAKFNTTSESYWPIPVGGPWLDGLRRKARAVLLANPNARPMKHYLDTAVRKGEAFIYLGPRDLWEKNALPMLSLGKLPLRNLPKIVYGTPAVPQGSEFVLNAAWFGRYAVVIPRRDLAGPFLEDLMEYLDERSVTRAAARHTVNLAWDFPDLPSRDALARLASLCRETNFKLVASSAEVPSPDLASCFDEILA